MLLDTEHAPNDPHMVHHQLMASRGIDENAPVWNALIQSLLALVASMAASLVFYLVSPFGASDAIDTADAL